MSLKNHLDTLITGMCAGMREDKLKAVILAAIPAGGIDGTWYVSWDPAALSDEKVFGDSQYRGVLDHIRIAVSSGDSTDIDNADYKVRDWPDGLIFYNLLLRLYAKWRDFHDSGADDTDSTSGNSSDHHLMDTGYVHAKLEALKMSMHK